MLKKLSIAIILLASLAGCKSKSAFNYSQEFVKKERGLLPDITSTEASVKGFLAAEQYDSIATAGERMEKLIGEKIKEIKNQPAPDAKEADNFKEAGIKYFEFMKSMYTGYKNYGHATTPEARDEEMAKLRNIASEKVAVVNTMQLAQKKFADANGFKIEDHE